MLLYVVRLCYFLNTHPSSAWAVLCIPFNCFVLFLLYICALNDTYLLTYLLITATYNTVHSGTTTCFNF